MTTATGARVVEGDAPAGACELAVVGVGDGVGREDAVPVQELEEQVAVACAADLQARSAGDAVAGDGWPSVHALARRRSTPRSVTRALMVAAGMTSLAGTSASAARTGTSAR